VDPDQFVFGGQIAVGPIAPSLMFVPGIDIGVGDNQTVVSGNFDLHYHLAARSSTWSPYLGAGMGIHNQTLERRFGDDLSDTNVGGNLLFGVTAPTSSGSRFFTELKLGLGDGPSMKMMAGWSFRM
jgi:hypothetical protein